MVRNLIAISLSVMAVIGLSACSQGGQLTLESTVNNSIQNISGSEFTNSSAQYATSLINGYKIQQSVGDFVPQVVQNSTINGYKLYSTVQGQLISE